MTANRGARAAGWLSIALVAGLVVLLVRTPRCAAAQPGAVRPAQVAGSFYPGAPEPLREAVTKFLKQAGPAVPDGLQGRVPRALVVPHAGYVYSGATAACAYKLLEGTEPPDRVILLGPPHRTQLIGACSVADFSAYETPLGSVPVDTEARAKLVRHEPFRAMDVPHEREHCLEVQLPFLQVLWPDPPPIVPVLVGDLSPSQSRAAADALAGIISERTLVVVSTDFTHYGTGFRFAPFRSLSGGKLKERIRELDMGAVKYIEALDPSGFRDYVSRTGATICGRKPVEVMLRLFAGCQGSRPVFLRWSNSGDVTGAYDQCVSYVAMAVYAPEGPLKFQAGPANPQAQAPSALTADDRRTLLRLAQESLRRAVRDRGVPEPDLEGLPDRLHEAGAAFVTLTRNGRLRGCIGHVEANLPLCACVWQMAAFAALHDMRFRPVQPDELDDIHIEISVLTPLQIVGDADEIRVGRDGLVVSGRRARGLLLPQVAAERGWTVAEFLQQTCRKAGLPPDAWEEDDVTVYRFQADVFNQDQFEDL